KPSMTPAQDQDARLEHMCRKLQLRPGQLLLDIGAGWGDLLFWAAEHHGVQAMGITQSRDQHAYVNDLITQKGLQGRVAMRLLDCRDLPLTPRFDRIASVGMFQHVDSAQLDSYFKRLHSMLKPGGLLLKHGLTAGGVEDHRLGARGGNSFDKHIFSGDQLVNVSHMGRSLSASGLALQDAENLGPHYARTLRAWLSGLEGRVNQARALTSGTSLRAWRLYLAGFAVALERGWLSIHQLLATRPPEGVSGAPLRCAPSTHVGEASHS
ncbi:MAG: SAM-dependent methyltransferase, partial [Betaproteobacteria bacterium HGW-Betaproteobacteria-16]